MSSSTARRQVSGIPAGDELDAAALARKISEIGLLAHRSAGLGEVVQSINLCLLGETGADVVGIALVDEGAREVVHVWGQRRGHGALFSGHAQPLGHGVVGTVVATGRPIHLDDVRTDDRFVEYVAGMRSELCVPLALGDVVVGALDVESREGGAFGAAHLALLQAVAGPVAQAIENARRIEEDRHHRRRLTILNQVARIVTSTVDLDDLLDRAVGVIRRELGYHVVVVGLVEGDSVILKAASAAASVDFPIGHRQEVGVGVVGQVIKRGESILVPDVERYPDYIAVVPGVRCEMCCALRVGDRVVGFLDAESDEVGAFEDADVRFLERVADHISRAVENARNLHELSRLRQDMSAMIVHDLRSPLHVIHSALALASRESGSGAGPDHGALAHVDGAMAACREMLVLIDGLLELQRMESGGAELDIRPCSAADVVRKALGTLVIVAQVREVALEHQVSARLGVLRADQDLLHRVLQNLVTNALKFTPPGGRVRVEVGPAPQAVLRAHLPDADSAALFVVADTGSGIEPEERERIFDRFRTLEGRSGSGRSGTGLGLAFCRQVVSAHAGAIWVESEPGQGARFHLLLP